MYYVKYKTDADRMKEHIERFNDMDSALQFKKHIQKSKRYRVEISDEPPEKSSLNLILNNEYAD